MDAPPISVEPSSEATVSALSCAPVVDDLDAELARLLLDEKDDRSPPTTSTDTDIQRLFATVEPPDAARVAALEARVAMLERRLEATLEAFEAEVQDRMTKAATEAALAVRAHLETSERDS